MISRIGVQKLNTYQAAARKRRSPIVVPFMAWRSWLDKLPFVKLAQFMKWDRSKTTRQLDWTGSVSFISD